MGAAEVDCQTDVEKGEDQTLAVTQILGERALVGEAASKDANSCRPCLVFGEPIGPGTVGVRSRPESLGRDRAASENPISEGNPTCRVSHRSDSAITYARSASDPGVRA